MQNRVLKPHLRNLFFRTSTLLQLGIKPVFVIEGEAPTLKHGEMCRRMQAHHRGTITVNTKKKYGRGRLQGFLKECCELLDALGVPYIQSQGEAESMCAALNAAGVVDACVSNDGDCFLYGAKVVYRNLTIDSKDPHVESFSMKDVTSELCLTRERLVALALLLGCDYCPAGVPGVGETWAVKLMTSLAGVDVLKRFGQWKRMTASDCLDSTEAFVWRKASALSSFPPQKVIEEFLIPKESVSSTLHQWQRPNILKMMLLGLRYLEWPEEYSLEKILPITTLWDQLHMVDRSSSVHAAHLQPSRIIKRRVRQGVPCFEVEWENNIKGLVDELGQPRKLVTIEAEDRFQTCFPVLVHTFCQHAEQLKAEKARKGRKAKCKKDTDSLNSQMDSLTISSQSDPVLSASSDTQAEFINHHLPSSFGGLSVGYYENFTDDATSHSYLPSSQNLATQNSVCTVTADHDSRDVFSTFGSEVYDTEDEVSQHDGDTQASQSGIRSHSFINRSVEYVPLGQRLNVLKSVEACNENGDVIDLDDSYTYVPLSQRLSARLCSQEGMTSSASLSSVASSASCSQDIQQPDLDSVYTHVPLSQRLKNRLNKRHEDSLSCSVNKRHEDSSSCSVNKRHEDSSSRSVNKRHEDSSSRSVNKRHEDSSSCSVNKRHEDSSSCSVNKRHEDSSSCSVNKRHEDSSSRSVNKRHEDSSCHSENRRHEVLSLLSSAGSDTLKTSSSASDAKCVIELVTGSSVSEKQEIPATTLTDGKTRRLGGAYGSSEESVISFTTQNVSKMCKSNFKATESKQVIPESVPNTECAVSTFAGPLDVKLADNCVAALPSSPNTSSKLAVSHLSWGREMTESSVPLDVHKQCSKKKVTVSKQAKKGRKICSQKDKRTIIMGDLLEDWSDHDISGTMHQSTSHTVMASCDKLNHELHVPFCKTQADDLPVSGQQKTTESLSSLVDVHSEVTTLSNSTDLYTLQSENGTPYHSGNPDTIHPESVWKPIRTPSPDAASFVSDGHFTLHHTLFTSMEESDESKDASCSSELSSGRSSRHVSRVTVPMSDQRKAVSSLDTNNHSASHKSGNPLDSFSFGQVSEPSECLNQPCGKSPKVVNGLFMSNDESSTEVADQASAHFVDDKRSPNLDFQTSNQMSSVIRSFQAAGDSCPNESFDDECLLPLSQRLKLKQSSTKYIE